MCAGEGSPDRRRLRPGRASRRRPATAAETPESSEAMAGVKGKATRSSTGGRPGEVRGRSGEGEGALQGEMSRRCRGDVAPGWQEPRPACTRSPARRPSRGCLWEGAAGWALGGWVGGRARAWARRGMGGRAPATQVRMSSCVQSLTTHASLKACAKSQSRSAAGISCQVPAEYSAFSLVYPTQPLFPASEMYLMVPTSVQDTMSGCAARGGRPRYRAEVARDGGGLAG